MTMQLISKSPMQQEGKAVARRALRSTERLRRAMQLA